MHFAISVLWDIRWTREVRRGIIFGGGGIFERAINRLHHRVNVALYRLCRRFALLSLHGAAFLTACFQAAVHRSYINYCEVRL